MRPKAANSLMVCRFLVFQINDTKLLQLTTMLRARFGIFFWTNDHVLTEALRMEARCLRVRCTRIATMLRVLSISAVRHNRMEVLTILSIVAVGAK